MYFSRQLIIEREYGDIDYLPDKTDGRHDIQQLLSFLCYRGCDRLPAIITVTVTQAFIQCAASACLTLLWCSEEQLWSCSTGFLATKSNLCKASVLQWRTSSCSSVVCWTFELLSQIIFADDVLLTLCVKLIRLWVFCLSFYFLRFSIALKSREFPAHDAGRASWAGNGDTKLRNGSIWNSDEAGTDHHQSAFGSEADIQHVMLFTL